MKYQSDTIGGLLKRLNQDIFIPGIQRPYVWEPERIVKLFDSLMRGYPINAFMFWELQPDNPNKPDIYRFVKRFRQGDIHNEPAELPDDRSIILVLDGQQRLTSLLIGLAGTYATRIKSARKTKASSWVEEALYLNLLQTPVDPDDVDAEEIDGDEAAIPDAYYGFKFASADKPPKADDEHIWFRVSDILRLSTRDQLDAAIEDEVDKHESLASAQRRAIRHNMTRLWEVAWKEDAVNYYLERDQSYDKVLDIFIRINDGGKPLSKSEFLMGIVTLRWQNTHARQATEDLAYHLRDALQQDNKFDREFLLRAGLFFNDLDFLFKISNFTPRNIAAIEAAWPETDMALRIGAELLRRAGIVGAQLTGQNALMLIALYVYKLNKGKPAEKWEIADADIERIRRWIVSVQFHNVLGGTADMTMRLYREIINQQLASGRTVFPSQELVDRMMLRGRAMRWDAVSVERLAMQEVKSRLGVPCLSLLYDRTELTAEPWVPVEIVPKHRLVDDRLLAVGVPELQVPEFQAWRSRLANAVLMTQAESREYYGMDFEDWVTTRSDAWLDRHLLPTDFNLYHERCFLDFISARKALIAERLAHLFDDDAVAEAAVAA